MNRRSFLRSALVCLVAPMQTMATGCGPREAGSMHVERKLASSVMVHPDRMAPVPARGAVPRGPSNARTLKGDSRKGPRGGGIVP